MVDLLLVLLSTLAVATGVLGPLLVRAIEQETVAATVTGVDHSSLTVYETGRPMDDRGPLVCGTQAAMTVVHRPRRAERPEDTHAVAGQTEEDHQRCEQHRAVVARPIVPSAP
ncbi:MAG: hypothetical protein ACRYG2_05585 [Janthinobacterium lividum]